MGSLSPSHFGHLYRPHFLFKDDYTNLNHGSFGAFPQPIRDTQHDLQATCESAPDQFLRYNAFGLLIDSSKRIAQLLNASPHECVFVRNATLGLNTVLRNIIPLLFTPYNILSGLGNIREKPCVIYFNTIYGAIEKTLISIRETYSSLNLRKVNGYTLPCSHEAILIALQTTLEQAKQEGLTVRACVFETITSMPAARFPFEAITRICREKGILSVIDGAHGVGQIPIDLRELDPDFFVSNCHKWLYTPRGCAVLYVPGRNQALIRTTLPTSWGFIPLKDTDAAAADLETESARFTAMFSLVGTADNTAFYCVPAALDYRQRVCGGEEAIYDYIQWLGQAGADLLAQRLGTKVMGLNGNVEMRHCAMANVLLPMRTTSASDGDGPLSTSHHPSTDSASSPSPLSSVNANAVAQSPIISTNPTRLASWLTSTVTKEYGISVVIFVYAAQIWLRVSGQIYLELGDFERLADVLLLVLDRVRRGEGDAR